MDFKQRSQKLRKIIDQIQCYRCKKVPSPNDENLRYACQNSHYLCENCKESKCRCGSTIALNVPSGIYALMLENLDLPWFCRYHPKGCEEIFEKADLQDHEEACIFRPVTCFYYGECGTPGILFKDIMDHVHDSIAEEYHGQYLTQEFDTKINGFTVPFASPPDGGWAKIFYMWDPQKLKYSEKKFLKN